MKIFKLTLILVAILAMGCEKDDCTCPENTPNPPTENPDPREAYVGNYIVTDSVFAFGNFSNTSQFIMSVHYGTTSEDTLFFSNYGNTSGELYALEVNGFVSIPNQAGWSGMGVSGSGSIDSLQFQLNYNEDITSHRSYGEKQ